MEIKRVAKAFGADLVGITAFDERWVYTHKYSADTKEEKPNELPEGLDNVVVIARAGGGPAAAKVKPSLLAAL